jgi:hypothetical protein
MILRFYDPFLRFEFVLHFLCRVKITILTTLHNTLSFILLYPFTIPEILLFNLFGILFILFRL